MMRRAHDEAMPDEGPILADKPRRRTFSAKYKLSILGAYEASAGDGD
jgi:hypothetical protein